MVPKMSTRADIAEFLKALDETQYLSPPRMQAYQRRLLARLLDHARHQTAFYAERLNPVLRTDGAFNWDRWRELPILTRSEAQDNFAALCARSLPPVAGKADEATSSGSTGRPLRHLTTYIQDIASACASERFFSWHDIDPGSLTVRIRAAKHPDTAYPKGRRTASWRAGHLDSEAIDLSISTPVDRQVEWLARVRPRYLATYPSNLREIAREAQRSGTTLRFGAIMTFGEMTSDDMRAAIADYFRLPPLDRYGSSEVGHISGTCPHSLKHHVASELVLLEIVDDDGQPAKPGSSGRIVVTPFYNLAMPLVRYELGDHAILSPEPCGCGRTLPILERIRGRSRNMFRFVDGTSIWPVLLSGDFQAFVPSRQFQVVQLTQTDIEFRYVPAADDQVNDLPGLTAYLRSKLHPSVSVRLAAATAIPRSEGGKYEDCMSLVT
jgi:phenylacetate-coenzyme A ligase PaaK-like adenylate-forming protein